MMKMNVLVGLTLGLALILVNFTTCSNAQSPDLDFDYYKDKCKDKSVNVENIVRGIMKEQIKNDATLVAALLRLQFHDCFVEGCDASLLLDGDVSEKKANPNLSVRGYEVIDTIKEKLESACGTKIVSCADIITMATRDAVAMSGGVDYKVQTGRLDGKQSLATSVNLPAPDIKVKDSIAAFAAKGLSTTDMVLLLGGGHTVGVAHCFLFKNRLYTYNSTHNQDPSMNKDFAEELKTICHSGTDTDNVAVNLDQTPGSSLLVDNGFYKQIKLHKGILEIDQAIESDDATKGPVNGFSVDPVSFQAQFGLAMVRLGAVEVKTLKQKSDGEVREKCRVVNSASTSTSTPLNGFLP